MGNNSFGHADAPEADDSVLCPISGWDTEAGFLHPVKISAHAWHRACAWEYDGASDQQEHTRLGKALRAALAAVRGAANQGRDSGPVKFTVTRVTTPGGQPEPCELWIDMAPGDDGDPTFTITDHAANDN